MAFNNVDLSTYVRVGRYDLPEPKRTTPPTNSLLAQEVSAVTYNWDTDTLFVVGDGSTSIVQVSKTGVLIDSMTLAPSAFEDPEGLTYIGNGKFALVEERVRQVSSFTYAANTTLTKGNAQTVKLGTTIGNIGIEGISYDPQTGGFIAVKEISPEGIFQTGIDFAAGTATNGSATTENSTNLFDPAKANLGDFADVFALSNLSALNGQPDSSRLLILSQESGKIVNIDRSGNISSSLTINYDAGNPASIQDQQHEGLTMDNNGFLYVVSENGGGDINRPQLWVYAPTTATNQAPTGISLNNKLNAILENTATTTRLKVADIAIADDGLGLNALSVSGADASAFEADSTGLYIKAGTTLDFETKTSYSINVNVDDATVGSNPDATTAYTLSVTDIPNELSATTSTIFITEVAPWSSGNSPVLADWFELTNKGATAVDITGWKFDDNSNSFAASVALNGITSIGAGESVIFIEGAAANTNFKPNWLSTNLPANLQIGYYSGTGVGLSTAGDAVNIFNASGTLQANVVFGASPATPTLPTFDNAALLNNATISTLSAVGTNGAFSILNTLGNTEIGSPGAIATIVTIAATDANAAEAGSDTGTFRITRTADTTNALTVNYTVDTGVGKATSGDFTPTLTGAVVIPAGKSFVDITITPIDDVSVEGNETVTINLTDTANYDLGTSATATVNIADSNVNPLGFSGVAAGDATSNDVILWTRTFDSVTKKGDNANLIAQVSTDPNFGAIAFTYNVPAKLDGLDHDGTVKVNATGLQSGTKYYYRFQTAAGELSSVGTFKTSPDANTQSAVRFGFSGDADGLMRPYSSTANFGSLNLDFFGFLGDTIYETASNGSPAATTNIVGNPAQALIDYHRKYLENLQPVSNGGFPSLQTLYSSQGNYTLLDNHELGNKELINGGAPASLVATPALASAANGSTNTADDVNTTGQFVNQSVGFKTLLQAYSDYQPIKEKTISAPNDPRTNGTQQLYNANQWGQNLLYVSTDTRSYRDVRLNKVDSTGRTVDDTGARADNPNRTLLGATQLAWLKQTLLDAQKNGTIWKFVAVSDPIDQIGAIGSGADGGKSWIGGYRAERNDLLKFIADNGIKNVVFLATDDHQNRINELTYWDNASDIGDQSKAKVLQSSLSIVDGPIGATGPDTVTDHSFANVKSLADKLAATQTAAGVNPIGLDPNFAGLKNVVREGDPNANTLRQPIDFYSPDTFNYTTFDISPDGKTLNVNVQGINSSATNSFIEPTAANPVRSILSFSLDATPSVLSVAASATTATETNTTPAVFTVTSDAKANVPLSFNYTIGGTATNGLDYNNLSGTATIAAGQSSVDIQIKPIDDTLSEGNENVTLTLVSGANNSINGTKSTATVNIIDNEAIPVGSTGDDDLIATAGGKFDGQNNLLFSGAGNDTVDLGFVATSPTAGNNIIDLGSGNDTIFVNKSDRVFGSDGNDEFDAQDSQGGNRISGGLGNDTFFLGSGDSEALRRNRVLGGEGNDIFSVSLGGGNLISGGAGADQFWIVNTELPKASNTVLDFQLGIDVIGIKYGITSASTDLKLSQIGSDTAILYKDQTLATLTGIQASSLSLTDPKQFVFA